ncbi:hypothetical protein DFH29DRAFT_920196, partial [Suillus ampliporus]
SFIYLGLWAVGTLHSTATLSIQRVTTICMSSGSCTVSIFSSPATATLAGQAIFFFDLPLSVLPVLSHHQCLPLHPINNNEW